MGAAVVGCWLVVGDELGTVKVDESIALELADVAGEVNDELFIP